MGHNNWVNFSSEQLQHTFDMLIYNILEYIHICPDDDDDDLARIIALYISYFSLYSQWIIMGNFAYIIAERIDNYYLQTRRCSRWSYRR